MSAQEIASSFVDAYYSGVSNNPQNLLGLYQPQSTATWEGEECAGPQAIITKISSLGKLQFNVGSFRKDVQISAASNALLIFVSGQLMVDSNPPMNFSQVFHLVSNGSGGFYVHNEIFRLALA